MFVHWPVPAEALRRRIPDGLTLEEFGGTAWVAISPFRISAMAFAGLPMPPFATRELNVRTYVTDGTTPGVWFLSLDTDSRLLVLGGRSLYRLPYVWARISAARDAGGEMQYRLTRPDGTCFTAAYHAEGPAIKAPPGSFDHWCVERYRLYTKAGRGQIRHADIRHAPWTLAPAKLIIRQNDLLSAHGLAPAGDHAPPRYAMPLEVEIGALKRSAGPMPSQHR